VTTKRKQTKATSRSGVKFVEDIVVKDYNCIFQEIDLHNDIGNDAYLEFIEDEEATGCCIAVQIKSGDSYVASNGSFVLKTDRDHFEYWHSHVLPVAAIIYSPTQKRALWCDVKEHLRRDPRIIETGPYCIQLDASQEFSSHTFCDFASHFLKYRELYRQKLGDALESFADVRNPRNCLNGVRYLVSFQRQNLAAWYYFISCFRNFRHHQLLRYLVSVIAYLPGHGDIFWHKDNTIEDQTRESALSFLKERFGRIEVVCMLESVTDGGGFARGAIGQPIEAIISQVKDRNDILESIAFDSDMKEDVRYWALLLLVYYIQPRGTGRRRCLSLLNKYERQFSTQDDEIAEMVPGIRDEVQGGGRFNLFC